MTQVHVSTKDFPERGRVAAVRDFYAAVEQLEFDAPCDRPFEVEAWLRELPGITIIDGYCTPCVTRRTRAGLADGKDDLVLCLVTNGGMAFNARGFDAEAMHAGDALIGHNDRPSEHRIGLPSTAVEIVIPRNVLAPRVADLDRAFRSKLPREAAPLLAWYARGIARRPGELPAAASALCAAHIVDLAALATGATRDAAENARHGGLRAARLARIKADIAVRFTDPGLTAERVAASYGISPQYLRALLNAEGTTLSDLLLGRRLEHMRRLLANPRFHARRISSLAFEAGFGDLSYFNRTFRRRYGMTPSELRAASAACDD